ncbi:MAG: ATP synthase F0 subunit B [Deltaproteobacteria bacterium]
MEVMEGLVLNQQFAIEFCIQLGLFLLCFVVLKQLVFKPLLELIHIREEKTHGLKHEAEEAKQKVAKLKTDYEAFIKAEHKKTTQWMDEEKKKIVDEENAIVQAARNEATERLDQLRVQINSEADKARGELSPLISDFASRIATKLVGKTVNISGADLGVKKNLNNRPVVQG